MSFRLNIGIVCYPTYGGSGVVATELARYLARIGHNIHVISYDFPVRMPAYDPNITFHAVSPKNYALFRDAPYTISLAAKCAEVAEESDLDILHVHYAIPHAVSGYLARAMVKGKRALKLVTTLHGTDITLVGSDPSYFSIVKFAIEESDAVTAVSNHLAEETISRFGITRPVEVIYNFINPHDFRQTTEGRKLKRLFAPDGERLICHISNFRPVKRACDAVEVFSRIRCREGAKLLMVGDGVDMSHVRTRVKELDLENSILFLGNRGDVHRIMEICEVLIMPSESESFGLAALEAMAAGCAIVCTTAGGIPEVVTQQCGFLHEVGDIDAMAKSVCQLLNDGNLLREMQESGRKRAFSEFDIRAKVSQYISCYKRVIGKSESLGPEYQVPRHLSD
jgi:N-acetyl-alpha-D-glucosaminyl L-malate synthase BshA